MEALYRFNKKTLFGKVVRWVLKDFNVILVGSEDSRDDVLQLDIPDEKVTVYTHWIDLERFKPADTDESRTKLGWKKKYTVLYLGRLIEIKGIHIFLKAAELANKDIEFKVIGDGPEEDAVKQAEQKLPHLEYIGNIPNEQIAPYYAAADVLAYPALYEEDLSLVILESMACGTPVINTNKGSGVYELNKDVAFVVRPDPKQFKEKIEFLYHHPAIRKNMSKNCVAFARTFCPQLGRIIIDTYEKAYKKDL